jgi:hypothetical protein
MAAKKKYRNGEKENGRNHQFQDAVQELQDI